MGINSAFKGLNITVCVYITALATQHATHRNRIILSSVACPPLPYLATLSDKRRNFRKNVIKHKMFVLIYSTTFVRNSFHSKNTWARYYYKCTHVLRQVPLLLSDQQNLNFLDGLSKITQTSNFTKFRSVGAELFHAGRRTDRQNGQTWQS